MLPEQPHRLGVRHRILEAEPEEAHERQPVPDLELGRVVRQRVERLQDQDLEHQHRVIGRPAALRSIRPLQRARKPRPERLEVDQEPRASPADRRSPTDADSAHQDRRTPADPSNLPHALNARESRSHLRKEGVFRGVRSAQPLPSGARTKAGELSAPRKAISPWKTADMYWLP